MQYPNKRSTMEELFGSINSIAIVDFPTHLNYLVQLLPKARRHTVDRLIDEHTLLPLYTPFLPFEIIGRIRQGMKGKKAPSIHMRSGIMASRISMPERFRYCPNCVDKDKSLYGETYWHRIHQAPGAIICPTHHTVLKISNIPIRNRKTRHEFIAANGHIHITSQNVAAELNCFPEIMLKIAQDIAWLLNRRCLNYGPEEMYRRYLHVLASQDLASYSGKVRAEELLKLFIDYYSSELLSQFQSPLDERSQSNWLFRLIRTPKSAQHPLHHLLLMHFLGHTADTFFSSLTEFQPFGKGPWPCLNRASDHFHHPKIRTYVATYTRDHGRPVGTFRCSCGFAYMRTGPDNSAKDQFRIDRMESFGSIWEEALRQKWADETLSLRQIARHLGVDPMTIKRQADCLGLSFPRSAARLTSKLRPHQTYSKQSKVPSRKLPADYYDAWLALREQNSHDGRMALRKRAPRVHAWLYRNDPEWLEANSPSPQRRESKRLDRIDWKSRDAELAAKVEFVVHRLKRAPGKPVRVTETVITRELGQSARIQKYGHKLPKTVGVIADLAETREAFAIRRIKYIADCYRDERRSPRRWELIRRAALRPDLLALPQIHIAVLQALNSLSCFGDMAEEIFQECRSQA